MANLAIKIESSSEILLDDIKDIITQARQRVISTVNTELVFMNWQIGCLIKTEVIKDKRSEYGEQIVATVSQQLLREFGKGFTKSALSRMIKFYETFPDKKIVATLSQQLGWSHFVEIIHISDPIKREFYAEMCRLEQWSIRTLRAKIQGMLFERTAISKKPLETIKRDLKQLRTTGKVTQDLTLKDPYLLEFLDLEDTYSEKDLENAILRQIEKFLLELGNDFSFLARQKRITIGGEDYYIDLLLFHRNLKRLFVIELKLGKFKASHKGQMELYLRWLNKYERKKDEGAPLGIILCAEKNQEQVSLLELEDSGIHIAEYLTQLPPQNVLIQKLNNAIYQAKLALGE